MKNTIIKALVVTSLTGSAFAGTMVVDNGGAVSAGASEYNDWKPMLQMGTQEFGIEGAINFDDDLIYNLNLSYGYFIRDNWEIGVRLSGQGGESRDDSYGGGLFTEYNFANNTKWVPFIGTSLNWAKFDSKFADSDSITVGINFGVKYFISKNLAISFSGGGTYNLSDTLQEDFEQQINIGTRFYF